MSINPDTIHAAQHALNELAHAADVLAEAATDLGAAVRQLRGLLTQADRVDAAGPPAPPASPDACVEVAAEAWGVTRAAVVSACREPTLVSAREGAVLLADRRGWSSTVIGGALHKDRTTVISARRRARARLETDPTFAARVGQAEVLLAAGAPLAGLHAPARGGPAQDGAQDDEARDDEAQP